jgi:hypothetical protein
MSEREGRIIEAAEAWIELTAEDAGVVVGQFATLEWRRRLRGLERAVRSDRFESSVCSVDWYESC